ELDHRRGQGAGCAPHLEFVSDLPGQVAGGAEPADGLCGIVCGEREETDVLLRERLAAQVTNGGEVLDALQVAVARSLCVAREEGEVAEVDERGGERAGRADGTGLLRGGAELSARGVVVALLAGEDAEHVEGVCAQ